MIPEDLRYTSTHEWIRINDDNSVTIGITDHAQNLLGDLVYVELPDLDVDVNAGDEMGVVESVKTAADFYAPVTGKILEVNEDAAGSPALINKDTYGDGWLVRMEIADQTEVDELLDHTGYHEQVAEEE